MKLRWSKTSLANRLNVLSVSLAAVAAIGSLSVALLQYNYSKESTALDQRPWVGASEARTASVAVGSPFIFILQLKNFGKTPANDLSIRAKGFPLYRGVGQDDESYEREAIQTLKDKTNELSPPQYLGTMAPTGEDAIPFSEPHPLSGDELAAMKQQNLRLYYFGTITYSDLVHKSHETQFCFKVGHAIGDKVDPSGLMVHLCKTWSNMN